MKFMKKSINLFILIICLFSIRATSENMQTNYTFYKTDPTKMNSFLIIHNVSHNVRHCTLWFSYDIASVASPIIMFANVTDNNIPFFLLRFSHLESQYLNYIDYDHANKGQKQIVQLRDLQANQTIFIRISMLGIGQISFNGLLNILQSNQTNVFCHNESKPIVNSIYCNQCPINYKGKFCDTYIHKLAQNENMNMQFEPGEFKLLQLQKNQKIYSISIKTVKNIYFFFQFKYFTNQTAGLINHWHSSKGNGIYRSQGQQTQTIFINTNDILDVSLAIVNFNHVSANLTLYYVLQMQEDLQQFFITTLLMFFILTLLFTALILCFFLRKYHNGRRLTLVETNNDLDSLTADQIQRYFPTVRFGALKFYNKDVNSEQPAQDHECVICLNQFKPDDKIKVAYCRHIFHDDCLMQWFSVLMNCPYCRCSFSKVQIIVYYEIFLTKFQRQNLEGLELIQCILKQQKQQLIQMNALNSSYIGIN